MSSPFPGMDPYLESPSIWSDFHVTFIVYARAELRKRLPSRYSIVADRYVWIRDPESEAHAMVGKPDLFIREKYPLESSPAVRTISAPVKVTLPGIRVKGSPYLKIVDREGRRLVTVFELLSPSNKEPGPDRESYLMKREEYLATGVNLVELDLLRSGKRVPLGNPTPPTADYYIFICRATEMPGAGVWPLSVRDTLPDIPVPLHAEDEDVPLPLQPCFLRTYEEAGFGEEIDYGLPPEPSLKEPDATWARDLLAARSIQLPPSRGEQP